LMRVLDADEGQLPHRLRQFVSLLLQEPIDFADLLRGLLYWNDEQRRSQIRWARQFYAVPDAGATPKTLNDEAVA
jgi:CRISPR type I-E-associated protein CasB/Cse2